LVQQVVEEILVVVESLRIIRTVSAIFQGSDKISSQWWDLAADVPVHTFYLWWCNITAWTKPVGENKLAPKVLNNTCSAELRQGLRVSLKSCSELR
jgi:hypothetical protein